MLLPDDLAALLHGACLTVAFTDVLGRVADSYGQGPTDPRLKWLETARPDQLLPKGDWRVCFIRGGRGSGKTRAGAQGMAEWVLGDTDGEGEYGIIAPTYADAWTKCIEGESGLLKALGTSMSEIKDHRSKTVRSAWRTYGQVIMHSGIVVYADSAAEGGLRIQGRNLRGAWCLAGDEKITTQRGQVPIKDVRPGDYALTRQGWRPVTAWCLTKRDAETVTVKTNDRHAIQLTSDHEIWTEEDGWKPAGKITPGMQILCLDRRITSSGEVFAGTGGPREATTPTGPVGSCTSLYGSTTTGDGCRLGTSSTTRTMIRRTTGLATSWIRPGLSTLLSMASLAVHMTSPNETRSARPRRSHGRIVSPGRGPVHTAVTSSCPLASVPGSAQRSIGRPSTVTSVEPAGRADVYDITVAGEHEFFASGILTKNCDEVGLWEKWETAWNESLRYAVRMGVSKIIATGTPKASRPARKLVRSLLRNDPAEGGVVVRRLRTVDNAANLSDGFMRSVLGAAQGTRLERQELEGELLDDVANSLWTRDLIDSIRISELAGHLRDVTLGVDPSDGAEDSDEQAYTLAGMGMPEDPHLYVAESWGGQESPAPFAKRCIRKAQEYGATIVVEKNHGGKWLTTVFQQVQKELGTSVRVNTIHASDAKRTRAEPVAAMYERYAGDGRPLVLHLHRERTDAEGHRRVDEHMPELEDQMTSFTGAQGERSPDRLDSLVWAMSGYLRKGFGAPGPAGIRQWAAQKELDAIGPDAETRAHRRLREAHGGAYASSDSWDLDTFSPAEDKEDTDRQQRTGARNNIRQWR